MRNFVLIMMAALTLQACAQLAGDLFFRTLFLPLDLASKDKLPPAPRVPEETKRLKKDWLIAASAAGHWFLRPSKAAAYGLKLGNYIGKSHFVGTYVRAVQHHKDTEDNVFGQLEHKYVLGAAELQYAYLFELAFVSFGAGSRYTSLRTRSRETGDTVFRSSPRLSALASLGLGLEYQWADFTFVMGSQWNFVGGPYDSPPIRDQLTEGLVRETSYSEYYFQLGYSPRD